MIDELVRLSAELDDRTKVVAEYWADGPQSKLPLGRDGDVFGATVTVRAGSSRVEPGTTPSRDVVLGWPSFVAAADEAGISRRYGGIHWPIDDTPGRDVGKKCGEAAFSIANKLWEGG